MAAHALHMHQRPIYAVSKKNCPTLHSSITDKYLPIFNFFHFVFSTKFATKSMPYISPHFKGVTPLSCKHKRPKLTKYYST